MVHLCGGAYRAGRLVYTLLLGGEEDENIYLQAPAFSFAAAEQAGKEGVVILLFSFAYGVQTVQQGATDYGNQL